jgi:hypothetical protein
MSIQDDNGEAELCIMRRLGGGGENDAIVIRIQDRDSLAFVEATMTLAEFANAITSQSVRVPAKWVHPERIGLIREFKKVFVPNQEHYALRPFEVDGWVGNARDLLNKHNKRTIDGICGYEVLFERWVKP